METTCYNFFFLNGSDIFYIPMIGRKQVYLGDKKKYLFLEKEKKLSLTNYYRLFLEFHRKSTYLFTK